MRPGRILAGERGEKEGTWVKGKREGESEGERKGERERGREMLVCLAGSRDGHVT